MRIGNRDWEVTSVCCMVGTDGNSNFRIFSIFSFFFAKKKHVDMNFLKVCSQSF